MVLRQVDTFLITDVSILLIFRRVLKQMLCSFLLKRLSYAFVINIT